MNVTSALAISRNRAWRLAGALVLIMAVGLVSYVPAQPVRADTLTLVPNAAGDVTGIADIVGSTYGYQACALDDADTTYVFDATNTAWEYDLYNLQDSAVAGTISNVTVYVKARSVSTPTRNNVNTVIKTNGVEYRGTATQTTTSYALYSTSYNTNPNTSAAWTWTQVNALQAGVELTECKTTGGTSTRETRCTYVYIVVTYTPAVEDISNLPTTYNFGTMSQGGVVATGLTYFSVTNNGSTAIDITIVGTDLTGGVTWTLGSTLGTDQYTLYAGLEGGSYSIQVTTVATTLKSNLAVSATQRWGLSLTAPSEFTDDTPKSGSVTLTAVAI
ncbi:MAG: hypothetical protein AB1597_09410 [Chloroflexota bacterium]